MMTNSDESKVRKTRAKESIIAELEAKIAKHTEQILALQEKIENIKHPKPRRTAAAKMKMIMARAKAANMSPEEIAKRLNISIEDVH